MKLRLRSDFLCSFLMHKDLLKAKYYSYTQSTSMSEEINMYSNALNLIVLYLHLYSRKTVRGRDFRYLFLCLCYIMPK